LSVDSKDVPSRLVINADSKCLLTADQAYEMAEGRRCSR